jgi:phenylpropionate dioxygenase-like ring-hydroxylating dioxygenase large terminal subunit
MAESVQKVLANRCPAETYMDILDRDAVPSPDYLREGPTPDLGYAPVAAARYFDPEFFAKEVKHVWPKVWHWACREEEIPDVGDHIVYNFVGKSFIIVRTAPNEIKALANSCLHRGRQLVECDGHNQTFRCAFHGMAWNCDGTLKDIPFAWDTPQWDDRSMSLPEARVDTWGGFVFMNMDHNAIPLQDMLGPIPEHFARYALENRYMAVHVSKKIGANWKAAAEAFMETHHVVGTHPQGLAMTADLNSQYDIWNDYVGRQLCAHAVQSPNIKETLSEQEIFNAFFGTDPESNPEMRVPEGMTARAFAAQNLRRTLSEETGYDYAHAGDSEVVDSLLYNVAPNMSFWAGMFSNLIYRFLPNGMDPETSVMDIVLLKPVPKEGPRPKPAKIRHLDFDEPVTLAAEDLGANLALVFEQDAINLPFVQSGMHASTTGLVEFTGYMEGRLRRHHQLLDKLIADGEASAS